MPHQSRLLVTQLPQASEALRADVLLLMKKDDITIVAQTGLEKHVSPKNHDVLAKILIALIITLNRHRPGEVILATMNNYSKVDVNDDFGLLDESTLTLEEKKNCKNLSIFYIAGSKNRKKVPVIITQKMKKGIDLLIKSRELLKVNNHLLFAWASNNDSFQGCDILRELKENANLQKPIHLTATGLRHHAATSSQLHTHDDTYIKRLAKFLGNDLKTHEAFYEMLLPLVQKGKVGTRLLKMTLPKRKASADDFAEADSGNQSIIVTNNNDDKDSNYKVCNSSTSEESRISTPKKKCRRIRWSAEEKEVIYQYFGSFFIMNDHPERKDIKLMYEKEKETLKNWTQQQVCPYINNIVTNELHIPTPEKNKMRKRFLINDEIEHFHQVNNYKLSSY